MDEKNAQVIHFLVRDLIAEIDQMIIFFRKQNFFDALKKNYVVLNSLLKIVEQLLKFSDWFNEQEELVCDQNIKYEIENLLKTQQARDYVLLADLYEFSVKSFLLKIQEYILSQYGILFDVDQYDRTYHILCENSDEYKNLLNELPKKCIFFTNDQQEFFVEPTATGAITLVKIENENKYYFHANANVYFEADQLANYWYQPEIEEYVIYGLSLGYHVKSLLAISGYSKIRIYESNLIVIQAAMAFGVLEEILNDKRVTFIYDKTYQQLNHYVAKLTKEHLFLIHYPSLYATNNIAEREALEDYFIQYNSIKSQARFLEGNFRKNILLYDEVVDVIKDDFMGKDIYIIGAGPSLDRNISDLKRIYEKNEWKEKSVIIAVTTVFRKLLKSGIVPDYIVASDAKPNTYRQLLGLEQEKVPLIGLSTLYYEFFQNYKGKKFIVFQEGYDKSEAYVKEHHSKLYETGGSVITVAIDVALRLEGRRIIFIGVDLAFTEGRNHASETLSSFMVNQEHVLYVKDIYGKEIATAKNLNIYRKWIERRIKDSKAEVIDATEGGALILGTKIMALKEVVSNEGNIKSERHDINLPIRGLVSVIIPTYNRANFINECIESVLSQSYQNLEVIIVDDGSTDDTKERVALIQDNRVRYVRMDKNSGPSAARNKGVSFAKGEYIAFQDSDDIWLKEKLEHQIGFMKKKDVDLCFCKVMKDSGVFPANELVNKISDLRSNWFPVLLSFPLISAHIVCKRDVFLKVGGFNENLHAFEDYEFSIRFSINYTIAFLDECLVTLRRVDVGVNGNVLEAFRTRFFILKKYYKEYCEYNLLHDFLRIIKIHASYLEPEVRKKEMSLLMDFLKN